MKRILTFAASMTLALAMFMAPDMQAQSRSGNSGTTRSTSGSTTSRSSGSTATRSSASSATRSSGSAVTQQQDTRRSTGTSTTSSRSTSGSGTTTSRSSGSTTTRSSGSAATQQQDTRRSTGTSTTSSRSTSGSTTSRSSSSTSASSSRSSGTTTRSSGETVRASGDNGSSVSSSGSARSSSSATKNSGTVTGSTARSSNVSRSGLTSTVVQAENQVKSTYPDEGYNYRYQDDMRVDDRHNMYRIPPRQRDPMPWDRPGYFWGDHPHYYGYRIHSLPPSWRRISHWGIDYYFYNGIYYRHFGGAYVVCRPPFGTPLEVAIDRAIFRLVRFAYYCDTYRTYSRTFDYYNVIARQNLIIAQQNARLIAQNNAMAINANRALTAYELAEKLGLVQSYAYANSEYFYQDGVFYSVSASGVYSTIVPPAGALVTSLPDDYEIIVMNGIEYYMVDNTVYRTTLFEGQPYLEVLGQMYGSLYSQYNVYR